MSDTPDTPPPVFLRLDDVISRVGLQRTQVYDLVRLGDFPRPVKLGRRMSVWVEAEVISWQRRKIEQRAPA